MKTETRTRGPRDRRNTIALGVLAIMASSVISSSACSPSKPEAGGSTNAAAKSSDVTVTPSPRASAAGTARETVPPPLADAGEFAENVYDSAKANDWKNADAKLAALKTAAKQLRTLIPKGSAEIDRLDEDIATLDRAVTARDQRAAIRAANQVTRDVADMTATYEPPVPAEVTRLDYYGRELEIWAETGNGDKLQATVRAMRRDWDALRPAVEARSPAEAEKFGMLVAHVEKAQTPAEFARLAKAVLDEVDNLEKLFHP
jgi:hypothetical protein